MRHRTTSSSTRVAYFTRVVTKTIIERQHPITGLITTNENLPDAWIRDNVYATLSVWALSMVYRKRSDSEVDRAKGYELEQSVVRTMRGILRCFMLHREKLEKFKITQSPMDSFHAKYDSRTCEPIVADDKWGHLQLDSISLYLLILAEATTAGLKIIHTLDEVSFVQNLAFYIETAYRIPDYGVWERGDKTNHGLPELNASSVGMTHAALKALDGLNLFGAQGGSASTIHTLPDETSMCHAVLLSMLPRESISKEVDSALLSVVGYPAFAVDDKDIVETTNNEIKTKLEGRYGCKRFLRDGYKTAKEDPNRLHYEPHELKAFENIECEWPLFFVLMALNALFSPAGDPTDPSTEYGSIAKQYLEKVEKLMVPYNGMNVIPELYRVAGENVADEYRQPGSQNRIPTGKIPHMWAQSLYTVAALVAERFLSPGELDPLNRRMIGHRRPEVVTQVVLLAEDDDIKERVSSHGITCQTIAEAAPFRIYSCKVLSYLFSHLGKNKRLGLSGRASTELGVLATSKLYMLHNEIFAFSPSFLDQRVFYLGQDTEYLIDMFSTTVAYLNQHWTMLGRPTVVVTLNHRLIDQDDDARETMIAALKNLQSGIISGHRVQVGTLKQFMSTSCVSRLSFLEHSDDFSDKSLQRFITTHSTNAGVTRLTPAAVPAGEDGSASPFHREPLSRRKSVVARRFHGVVSKRRQSVYPSPGQLPFPSVSVGGSTSGEDTGNASPVAPNSAGPSGQCGVELSLEDFIERCERDPVVLPQHLARPTVDSPSHTPHGSGIFTAQSQIPRPRPSTLLVTRHPTPASLGVSQDVSHSDIGELIESLRETTDLYEQADLVHALYLAKGLDWPTPFGCSVKELLVELAGRAAELHEWWLVRHANGVLRRRPEDLAKCLTDLLVRGKQVCIGLPPEPNEKLVSRPLPPDELEALIWNTSNHDPSLTVLTQELLVALSMLVKSEKRLFSHMIRLRIGLITQVMASELAATLSCSPEDATSHLFNLSPYQLKILLYRVISGSELVQKRRNTETSSTSIGRMVTDRGSKRSFTRQASHVVEQMTEQQVPPTPGTAASQHAFAFERQDSSASERSANETPTSTLSEADIEDLDVTEISTRGQWFRRRRLDGALNRVPIGFYAGVWRVLNRCDALLIYGRHLPSSLTREMTQQELKFALTVEAALNRVPDPVYRQFFVEAISVLTTLTEHDSGMTSFHGTVAIDGLIAAANDLFLVDQESIPGGSAQACCANQNGLQMRKELMRGSVEKPLTPTCHGPGGICAYFYDSAPSGKFGTLSYFARAAMYAFTLPTSPGSDTIDCAIS